MKNNLVCDVNTGICGEVEGNEMEIIDLTPINKSIEVYYVTDPICSHCWALEPVLRRFREQYGHYFNFHVVMGGLLEKWGGGPVDPANGISGPQDVAGHWREVGEHSRMPIDGTLWYDDPVQSSFPPSRVFKVIQKNHSEEKAYEFIRRTREQLFAFNQNIAEQSAMVEIVNQMGLNGEAIVNEAELPSGQQLLNEDFKLAASLGVRGFPTIVMVNEQNQGVKIVGARSLEDYVHGLKRALNTEELTPKPQPPLSSLLQQEKLLFSKEIEAMYDLDKSEMNAFVEKELPSSQYHRNEVLGESYVTSKLHLTPSSR